MEQASSTDQTRREDRSRTYRHAQVTLAIEGDAIMHPVLVAGKQPRLDLIVGHSHQAVASGEEGAVLLPRLVIVHSLVLECQGLFGVQAQDFSI